MDKARITGRVVTMPLISHSIILIACWKITQINNDVFVGER